MNAPDVISLIEVQDKNGSINDDVVNANQTYQKLIPALENLGIPAYDFVDIPPRDDEDGGEPGGNIRVGLLFRPSRITLPGFLTTPLKACACAGVQRSRGAGESSINVPCSFPSAPPLLCSSKRLKLVRNMGLAKLPRRGGSLDTVAVIQGSNGLIPKAKGSTYVLPFKQ